MLVKLKILNIFNIIGKCIDDSRVDAVLKTEGFGEDERIVIGIYLNGGRCIRIKLNDHFDRFLFVDKSLAVLSGGVVGK